MHPGQAQRPELCERTWAWRGQRVRPAARGAWQVPSASGQTHPGDRVDGRESFRGLPLPRPLSEFQGTLALFTPIDWRLVLEETSTSQRTQRKYHMKA
jgi:hypothetical protein